LLPSGPNTLILFEKQQRKKSLKNHNFQFPLTKEFVATWPPSQKQLIILTAQEQIFLPCTSGSFHGQSPERRHSTPVTKD